MDVLSLLARLSLDSTEYDTGLKNAESRSSSFASKLSHGFDIVKTGAKIAFAAAETAVTAFAASAIRAGSQFDASMAQVAATMGMTTEQMQKQVGEVDLAWGHFSGNLREYAQEMGAHTAFSASQAAQALNYMALAGYDAQTSMSMLPNVLNLAAAGGIELAQASDMVTDAQSALDLSLERTSTLVSEMAKTASRSNTSVEQLGSAILTVGGTARQLHGGMIEYADGTQKAYDGTTELSAALGLLADNGIKGAEGGTALRNVLTTISGKKFDKTFGQMGVAVYDATGEMRSLKDILTDMNAVMDGMTTQEKTNLIQNTFDARVLKSANALLGTSTERWNELTEAILESQGAAEAMAETQLDNLQGDITMFKSALEGAQIAISDGLTPTLRDFTKFGAEALQRLTESIKEGGLTSAMETLGDIIADGVDMIVEKLPEYVEAGTQLLTSVISGFTKNASKFAEAAASIIKSLLSAITENLPTLLQAALEIVEELANGIIKALPEMIPAVVSMIEKVVNLIIEHAPKLIEAGVELIVKLADGLVKAIPKLVPAITKAIATIIKTIVKNAPKILKAVGDVIKSVVTEIGKLNGVEGIIGKVALAFAAIKVPTALIGGITKLTGGISAGFQGIGGVLSAFNTKMKGVESSIGGFFSNLKTGVSNGMQAFNMQMEAGNASVGTFLSSMKGGLSGQFGSLKDKVNAFSNNLSIASKGLLTLGGGAVEVMGVSDSFDKLLDGTENVGGALLEMGGSVGTAAAAFTAAFGVPGGLIATAIGGVIGLILGLQKHLDEINMEKAQDAIADFSTSVEGSTHTIHDYADSFKELADMTFPSFDRLNEKFNNLGQSKESIDDVVTSIEAIGTAMQSQASLTEGQVNDIIAAYDTLKTKMGEYITEYYDFSIQQLMANKAYEMSRAASEEEAEAIERRYSAEIRMLYSARDAEIETANAAADAVKTRVEASNEAEQTYNKVKEAYESGAISGTAAIEQLKAAEAERTLQYSESEKAISEFSNVWGQYQKDNSEFAQAAEEQADQIEAANNKLSGSLVFTSSEVNGGFQNMAASLAETVGEMKSSYEAVVQAAETSKKNFAEIHGENSQMTKENNEVIDRQLAEFRANYEEYLRGIEGDVGEFAQKLPQMLSEQGLDDNAIHKTMWEFGSKIYGPEGLQGALEQAAADTEVNFIPSAGQKFSEMMQGMFTLTPGVFGSIIATLNENYKGVVDQSTAGLSDYVTKQSKPVGNNLGIGFIEGAEEKSEEVKNAGKGLGLDAIAGLEEGTDSHSPSVAAHNIGVNFVIGFNEGIEEQSSSTSDVVAAWVDGMLTAFENSIKDIKTFGETLSKSIETGFSKSKDKLKETIVKPIKNALKQIEKQYSNYKSAGQKIIDNLKNGFTSKITDLVSKAKDIAEKIGKAFKDKDWKQIGQYITDGIKAGIEAGKSKVIEAAVDMATKAYEAAKEALEISSPSKKMKELGKWLAYGLAEGIAQNEDEAVQESEEMANKVLSEAQRILDGYKDFHAVSLKDEIYYWKQVKGQLQEGTEAYATALKTIKELQAQLSERKYTVGSLETNYGENNFSGFMADSLNDLILYQNALKKNGMNRADRDSAIISAAGQRLENFKVFNEMTIEEEKQFWEVILANVKEGSQAWYDISAKIKALDEEIAEESTRAAEEAAKTAEQLVNDFYAAAEKIEEERGNRIKALNQKYEKYYSEREKLDNNYHRNLENLNNKEIQDIQKLEDAYENSVNSRKNSIMGMTNLFDRTAYGQTWSKEYLQETLAQQVEALEDWDKELDNLGSRLGTDNPLVEELSNMGVGSLFTLKEINSMSDAELAEYSKMYAKKMQVAEQRARDDNAGLRRQTNAEIANIRADYEKQRGDLYEQYQADLKALEESLKETDENILKEVNETFLKTNESYAAEYEKINKDADTEMTALENQFRSDLTQLTSTCKTKGREVGNGMTNGMKKGIEENKSSVINAAVSVAVDAYRAACAALGVASPSKKFKYIGKMTAQGFIEGIRGMSGEISKATKDTFDVGADVAQTFTVDDRAAASRGGFVQNLTVNAPQALDPSEVARQTRLMNQQMVLALRGVG